MTTKEQERKALEQIKKIVAGLGEGSYIGTAFEGCFEVAEENIENDFACSMKQRAEHAEKINDELHKKIREATSEMMRARDHAAGVEEQLKKSEEYYEKRIATLQEERADADASAEAAADDRDSLQIENLKLKARLDQQDAEILKLKAKLFDLLFAEK